MSIFFSELDRLELANDLIASMVGTKTRAIFEAKKHQDSKLIIILKGERDILLKEQRLINSGDQEMRDKCLREYAPILKAETESFKKGVTENVVAKYKLSKQQCEDFLKIMCYKRPFLTQVFEN